MGCAVSTEGDSAAQQVLLSHGVPPPVIEAFEQAFDTHAVPLSVTSEQEVVTGAGLVQVMMEVAEGTFDDDVNPSRVKQYLQRYIPYQQLWSQGVQVEVKTIHGRTLFYDGNSKTKNVKIMVGIDANLPDTAGRSLAVAKLGRYIKLQTPDGGAWRGWLLSAEKGAGALVEATEECFVDDWDSCVFEVLLPFAEDAHLDEAPFQLPTSNKVLLLTRWGSVIYAPVAPDTAPQTHVMADGKVHIAEEHGYQQRDEFTLESQQVNFSDFAKVQFTGLQASHLIGELWQFCKHNLDSHIPYPTETATD